MEESSDKVEKQQPKSEEVISEQPSAPTTGKHKSHYRNYILFSSVELLTRGGYYLMVYLIIDTNTNINLHSFNLIKECGGTEQEATCAPAVEETAGQAESQQSPASPPQAETQSMESPVRPTPNSQQGPGEMVVPEMQGGDTTAEQKTISTTAPPSIQAPSTSTPEEEEEEEEAEDEEDSESMAVDQEDQKKPTPCLGSSSPSSTSPRPPSVSLDTQGCPSADETDCRALPQSEEDEDEEEEEEEEDDDDEDGIEPIKCLRVKIKEEPVDCLERQVKVELLDEASNMSHGDGSSSGFLGSPAEPDPQDFCLLPSRRSRADSLLTETDDSLPFEPHKCDGEKMRRRGSPGRSRIKQVRCSSLDVSLHSVWRSVEGVSKSYG